MVRLFTVMEPGKLMGVEGLMATAFQPEFVIITDCELPGRTPSDQFAGWSQLALVGFIQEFTCAQIDIEVNAINDDATKHSADRIPLLRHINVRIVHSGTPRPPEVGSSRPT